MGREIIVASVDICGLQEGIQVDLLDDLFGDEDLGYFFIVSSPDFGRDALDFFCAVGVDKLQNNWHRKSAFIFEGERVIVFAGINHCLFLRSQLGHVGFISFLSYFFLVLFGVLVTQASIDLILRLRNGSTVTF